MMLSKLQVFVPKFTLRETANFSNTLRSMGAVDMFSLATADFRNMTGSPVPLCVGDVVQKALIEVSLLPFWILMSRTEWKFRDVYGEHCV